MFRTFRWPKLKSRMVVRLMSWKVWRARRRLRKISVGNGVLRIPKDGNYEILIEPLRRNDPTNTD